MTGSVSNIDAQTTDSNSHMKSYLIRMMSQNCFEFPVVLPDYLVVKLES